MTEISTTSSIGACWPPQVTTQERIRGFYTDGAVTTPEQLDEFADHWHNAAQQLGEEATRLSIRLVTTPDSLRELEDRAVRVEAAMPLTLPTRSGEAPTEYVLAYTGTNASTRRGNDILPPEVDQTPLPTPTPHGILWRWQQGSPDGPPYRATVFHNLTDRDRGYHRDYQQELRAAYARPLQELYEPFGYDLVDTRELLDNPNNFIVIMQDSEGRPVSTAMAEVVEIAVDGLEPLVLAEITEASTRPELRGQGLYRRASGLLISMLATDLDPGLTPIVYGECNTNMPGVLQAARQNHRRFAALDADRYGPEFSLEARLAAGRLPFGLLEQNFRVEDGVVGQNGRSYNDFAVSYVPHSVLEAEREAYARQQREQRFVSSVR